MRSRLELADGKVIYPLEEGAAELSSSSVTHWLQQWRQGNQRGLEAVMEQTYEELMRLDDRELADINIRRGEIDAIARHTARSA